MRAWLPSSALRSRAFRLGLVAALITLASCSQQRARNPNLDGDDDDDDGGVQPGPPAGLECEEPFDTPAPGELGGGACVTDVISCGDTVQGTNLGGSTHFGSAPGEQFGMCAGSASQTNKLDGPERVYRMDIPAGTSGLSVRLKSCTRSMLFWYQGSACSTSSETCSYAPYGSFYDQHGDIFLSDTGIHEDRVMWFVVEGYEQDGGNFTLSVDCH